jgi:hypothetical protein
MRYVNLFKSYRNINWTIDCNEKCYKKDSERVPSTYNPEKHNKYTHTSNRAQNGRQHSTRNEPKLSGIFQKEKIILSFMQFCIIVGR